MKALKLALLTTLILNFACGVDETSDPQQSSEIDFYLTDNEGFALKAGVVFTEQCTFSEGVREVLVLTPWALDCDGAKINNAPTNWKAVTIALDDGCGYDDGMYTAEQSTEILADGVRHTEFTNGHSHDVRRTYFQSEDDGGVTPTVSVEFNILPKSQVEGSDAIGYLSANVVHCGTKESEGFRDWWQPSSSF